MESSKVYVNVMAEFTNDGRLLPRSFEITCVRCKKEIVGVVDEIYMKIFENCRGKEHDQEKASRYSTDMEALRQRKRAM